MSLPEQAIEAIPAETSQITRKAFPQGHKYMQMRDVLGTIYTDDYLRIYIQQMDNLLSARGV